MTLSFIFSSDEDLPDEVSDIKLFFKEGGHKPPWLNTSWDYLFKKKTCFAHLLDWSRAYSSAISFPKEKSGIVLNKISTDTAAIGKYITRPNA